MYIANSAIHPYGGFELDVSHIGGTTIRKDRILLLYEGPLPDGLTGGKASISITLQVGLTVNVLLHVSRNGATEKFIVQASAEEIDRLLDGFFYYDTTDEIKGYTRFDCGLDRYWLGYFQSNYSNWLRLTREPYGIRKVADQLTPENRDRLVTYLTAERAI